MIALDDTRDSSIASQCCHRSPEEPAHEGHHAAAPVHLLHLHRQLGGAHVVIMLLLYCVMATLAAAVHATAWFTWFTAQPGRAASSRAVAKQVVRS